MGQITDMYLDGTLCECCGMVFDDIVDGDESPGYPRRCEDCGMGDDNMNIDLVFEVADRAEDMNLLMFDKLSLTMDLEVATNEFDLRLNDLLNADDFNFSHDIVGIQKNINRDTGEMEGMFVPRFAGH